MNYIYNLRVLGYKSQQPQDQFRREFARKCKRTLAKSLGEEDI